MTANAFRTISGSPAHAARRMLGLALVVLAAACGSRSAPPPGTRGATADAALRVLNHTHSDVAVEVDGRPVGDVPAGGEAVFTGLEPGTHDLRGAALDGALEFRRDLLPLEAGETFTWVLREGGTPPAAEAVAAVDDADATILVENSTPWDVEVLLNGQVLGVAAAGRSAPFAGIVPGSYRLEARSPEASFPREYPNLEAGETFTWRLRDVDGTRIEGSGGLLPAPGTGRLRVENPHPVPLVVLANGTPLGTVEARRTRIFDELVAQRMLLAAESPDRTARAAGPSTRIEPGRVTLWRIGPLSGARAPSAEPGAEPAAIPPAVVLPPGADGLPPSVGAPPVDAAPGAGAAPPSGAPSDRTFIVENGTPQDLQILADGRVIGTVGAGMTERFTNLPSLRFTPRARSASGTREFEHPPVDLSSRSTFTWIILP